MKLNAAETALMNNPVRRAIHRRVEAPMVRRLGGTVEGERVLEIGLHPPKHDRFGAFGFVHELEQQGLHVGDHATTRFFGDFVVGVATLVDSD